MTFKDRIREEGVVGREKEMEGRWTNSWIVRLGKFGRKIGRGSIVVS